MIIHKLPSFWQRIRYTKLYRLPMWAFKKVQFLNFDKDTEYTVSMRLGHKMIVMPTERYLSNILFSRQYHDEDIYFVDNIIPENGVVLDIGANIGLYSCAFAEAYKKKNVKVYAIEALRKNYDLLVRNKELNSFGRLLTYQTALGEEDGELTFYLPSEGYVGNAVGGNILSSGEKEEAEETRAKEVVPMTTLDKWAKQESIDRCDFLKIDVEGAEMLVFKGGKEFLERTRPIIKAEYNKAWLDNVNVTIQDFIDFFGPLEYEFFVEQDNEFINIDPNSFDFLLVDLLLVPKEKMSHFIKK